MTSGSPAMRRALMALASVAIALAIAGCGSSAATSPSPVAAPSQAAPASAPAASTPPAESASAPAPAVSPAGSPGLDPAAGLKVDAPYKFADLPPAMQQALQTQMGSGLGALGGSMGFRQIEGATGQTFLMVFAFPSGTVSASTFQTMIAGMSTGMGATLQTTSVDGVDVASGPSTTGGVSFFLIGDHALIVISEKAEDALPVSKALISANK